MFAKIINFLVSTGETTESIAIQAYTSQTTVCRLRSGAMPRWDVGQRLRAMDKAARAGGELAVVKHKANSGTTGTTPQP